MFVKPASGIRIRDFVTLRLMPPEGDEVDETNFYWNRLLRDGDVIEADPPKAVADAPGPAAPAVPAPKVPPQPTE